MDLEETGNLLTAAEAREKGITWDSEPLAAGTCRFCGKELQPRGLVFGNKIVLWQPYPVRCECEGAQKYWAEYNRREKETREEEARQERQRAMRERIDRLFLNSGIKRRFIGRTFQNFKCDTKGRTTSYNIAKEYADNFEKHSERGEGLYIEGTNGTGKTHLAVAIATQLINKGVPVICKTSSDMLSDIKRVYDGNMINEQQILQVYRDVDLLVVDDLGKEQCTDWAMSMLYRIVNDRYENLRPIIITTNYNADDLVAALTPPRCDNTKIRAIVSRLRENCSVISMAWADARAK